MSNIKATTVGFLTSIFVFLLPFVDVSSGQIIYGAVNSKYFFILSFVVFLGLYFSYLLFKGEHAIKLSKRWLLSITSITLGIYYLSGYLGADFHRSLWSDILRSTGLLFTTSIVFLAFVLSELLSKKDWVAIFRSIAISGGILSFVSFFGQEGLGISGKLFSINFESHGLTFGNSTFFGAYLLLSLIITLVLVFYSNQTLKQRKFFIGLAIIQILSPFLINLKSIIVEFPAIFVNPTNILGSARASGATAILVIFYIIGLFLIRQFFGVYKKYVVPIWLISFLLLIVFFNILLFIPNSFIQEKYIENSTGARIIIWQGGLEAFRERPLLGWGPENFRFAHEKYFDNRLYLEKNIGEVWFDRAHNITIDNLVSVGLIGSLSLLLAYIIFGSVLWKAYRKDLINIYEFTLFGTLPFFHFIQLQTSFNTPSTYALLGLVLGYVFGFEKEMMESNNRGVGVVYFQKIFAGLLLVLTLVFFSQAIFSEFFRQQALINIFKASNQEQQISFINKALKNKIDFESLRLSSTSMIKGSLEQIALNPEKSPEISKKTLEQLTVYEGYYQEYLHRNPQDYRMRMNYVHLLLIKTVLGENKIKDSMLIVSESYNLSPNNPLTYVLDSLVRLYGGDLKGAIDKINEALALNPDIEFSQEMVRYIDEQRTRFPNVSVVKLENL